MKAIKGTENIDIPIPTEPLTIPPKKTEHKTSFRISHFLSLIIVLIISFIAFVIIIDTFKGPLFNYFPNLELVFYNLFETIKDINLFFKDIF